MIGVTSEPVEVFVDSRASPNGAIAITRAVRRRSNPVARRPRVASRRFDPLVVEMFAKDARAPSPDRLFPTHPLDPIQLVDLQPSAPVADVAA